MRLNPDCIRDVLLKLESVLKIEAKNDNIYTFSPIRITTLAITIEREFGYTREDVVYSALQLWESGYIATDAESPAYGHLDMVEMGNIIYITPKGHEFISSIYSKEAWSGKIKPILGKMGNVSLSIIEAVSKGITDSIIEKLLAGATQNT